MGENSIFPDSENRSHYLSPKEASAFPWPTYFAEDSTFEKECLTPFMNMLPQGGCVLDLGCGVGIETRKLERSGFRVYPLDANPNYLKVIAHHFPKWMQSPLLRAFFAQLLRIKPIAELFSRYFPKMESPRILGDALNLPIREDSLDGCLIKHLLTFGSDGERLRILREVYRALKTGGVIAIYNEARDVSYDIRPGAATDAGGHYPVYNPDEHQFSRYAVYALNEAGLKRLLKTAGFHDIEIMQVVTTTDRFGTTKRHMVAFAKK